MKKVHADVQTRHKVTGRTLRDTIEVAVYDEAELAKFKNDGMKEKHAELLNKIIVIRAQDSKRLQLVKDEDKAVKKLYAKTLGELIDEEEGGDFTITEDDDEDEKV